MSTQLRLVVVDFGQKVLVNDNVEIMQYTSPVTAPDGVADTSKMIGIDVVSFGYDNSNIWGPTTLKDGTVIEFTHNSNYNRITAIDERNLS